MTMRNAHNLKRCGFQLIKVWHKVRKSEKAADNSQGILNTAVLNSVIILYIYDQ